MVAKHILANRYELLDKIGTGGMAVVYRAYDTSLDRTVAIKLLRDEYADDPEFARRFQKEAQAVARLSHQNIVNIYDYGESDGMAYLVMEYVQGHTLKEIISRTGPLPVNLAIDYGIQLCYGMAQAHDHDIIHKDIKPHNVMVDANHTVKITDFGIAQAMNNLTITHNKGILGSAHYFSPEQARGDQVDFETDIYSLGIVMYEMLTGKVPFTGDNPVSVALKHMQDKPQSLMQQRSDIPIELERIIFKALEKKPSYRFKSMQEMADALIDLQLYLEEKGYFKNGSSLSAAEKYTVEPLDLETGMMTRKESYKRNTINDNTRVMDYDIPYDAGHRTGGARRASKKRVFMLIAGALALFLVPMFLVQALMGSDEVVVPELHNKTVLEAEKLLTEADLKILIEDEVYDEDIEKDRVVSQLPKGGTKVKEGREIAVVVSLGSSEIPVPDLSGKTEQEARIALENEDLVLGNVTLVTDSEKLLGVVVYQSVEAEKPVKAGTSIDVMINDPDAEPQAETVTVPSLKGKTLEEALQALRSAGLEAGNVTQVSSTEYYNNYVVSQQSPAGSSVEKGTAVGLSVSTGPGPEISAQFDLIIPQSGNVVVTLTDATGTSVLYQKRCEAGERLEQSFLYHESGTVTITCNGEEIWSKVYES
ncbi:MAG: Stk1 family PASTA domain-containing Ser/Thr kinase [Peptococcaceae bacterium]|nr:Stk1 family PASTA domain-containing Ser/Thr kinase [Peptococcaceae bacterium]